jgi:hypothetical protein
LTKLINSNLYKEFVDLLKDTKQNIRIISPFIGENTAKYLAEIAKRGIDIKLITRFNRTDFSFGASNLKGLLALVESGTKIFAVKKLHTKLYIFDANKIILGSSNFTTGGLETNIELNILIDDDTLLVNTAIDYFEEFVNYIDSQYIVTKEKIEKEIEIIGNKINTKFDDRYGEFGQEMEPKNKYDSIERSLKNDNNEKRSAWIKYEGISDIRRQSGEDAIKLEFEDNNYKTYFSIKPRNIQTGDIVFLARHTFDKNNEKIPIVYGYGIAKAFDEKNIRSKDEQDNNEDHKRWPYYIYMHNLKYVHGKLNQGISFFEIFKDINVELFKAGEKSLSITKFKQKYSQKTHMKISETGKKYLMDKLNSNILVK